MKKHIFSFAVVSMMLLFLFAFVVAVSYEVESVNKVDQPALSVLNAPAPTIAAAPITIEKHQGAVADFVSEGVIAHASNLSVACVGCTSHRTNGLTSGNCTGLLSQEARTFAPPDVGGQSLLKTSPNACHHGRLQRNSVLLTYRACV